MTASEIERLVAQMEAACAALLAQPHDRELRKSLHGALADALDDGFTPERGIDNGDGKLLYGMMRQAAGYARIARGRIENVDAGRYSDRFASEHIAVAARDLQWILSQLRRHLELGA
jgi:hypothetical protein